MAEAIQQSEAEVKRAVSDFLTYAQNQGKLLFFRLNAGSFILTDAEGKFRRRVKGAPAGTADFVVLQGVQSEIRFDRLLLSSVIACRVTFLECKSSKGKQTSEQRLFEVEVGKHHCQYFLIRNADQLSEILR